MSSKRRGALVDDIRGLLQERFPGKYVGNICRKPSKDPVVRDILYLEGIRSADEDFDDIDLDNLSDDVFLDEDDDEFAPTVSPEYGVVKYKRENPQRPLKDYPMGVKTRLQNMEPNRAVCSLLLGSNYEDRPDLDVEDETKHNWGKLLRFLGGTGGGASAEQMVQSSSDEDSSDDNLMHEGASSSSSSPPTPGILRRVGDSSSSSSPPTPGILRRVANLSSSSWSSLTDGPSQLQSVIKWAGKDGQSVGQSRLMMTLQDAGPSGGNKDVISISSTESVEFVAMYPPGEHKNMGNKKRRRSLASKSSRPSVPENSVKKHMPREASSNETARLAPKTPPIRGGSNYMWAWDA
ncbi:hypothetical protein [Phascolarctid gammaherpesvirus 1]|uniref:Uncharacterized protein n=1 Tax=Phascolarctid gammaherpesvirus 1 TaxID=2249313 RepID=A0A3S8D7R2_9GAMA|nr:hypothetical protein KM711_gp39 [Phascolarctid gammaherpesvirus 1]AZB49215.1 hypothetical protein [Phascolarctid gammaherpesvirus 1]